MEMGSSAGSRLVRDAAEEKGVGGRDAAEENRAGAVIQEVYSSPAVDCAAAQGCPCRALGCSPFTWVFFPPPSQSQSPNQKLISRHVADLFP